MSCIFCKIIAGESPAAILYRDEQVIAFRDIHPIASTHILIVPLRHISSVNELEEADAALVGHMALAAKQLADAWTVIAFPGERPVVPVYGLDAAVLKSDEAGQLASWLFIYWLLQPENQVRLARAGGLFPVTHAAFDLLKGDYAANAQKGAAAGLLTQAVGYPQSARWGLANKVLADGFVYFFRLFPGASAETVLGQMDETVQDLTK